MLLKAKIYLKPGEKPPKGLEIKRGPKGGLYYESKLAIKKPVKHKIVNVQEIFEAKNLPRVYQKARDAILDDIQKKEHFSKEIMDRARDILTWWDNHGYEIKEAAPIWYAASLENGRIGFPPKVRKQIKDQKVDKEVANFLRHVIRRTKKLLTQKYGDTPIVLYRGIDAKSKKFIDDIPTSDEKFKVKNRALESWSNDMSVAKLFAGPTGVILKTEVKANQIGYFSGFCLPHFTSDHGMEFSLNSNEEFQTVERIST